MVETGRESPVPSHYPARGSGDWPALSPPERGNDTQLVERRQRSLGSGFPEWDPAATYMRVRASLEHVMQISWRKAETDEKRMLLWLHELPEDDLPTDRWRREWARYFEECDSGMRLTLPLTREEVPGAEAATPSSGLVRVLVAVEARGSSVHVRFAIRETLAAIRVGELRAPERVLCNDPVSTRPRGTAPTSRGRALYLC